MMLLTAMSLIDSAAVFSTSTFTLMPTSLTSIWLEKVLTWM
jgi:hypothetical protein